MSARTARLDEVCEINPRAPKNINDDTVVSFLPMSAVSEDGYVAYEEARIYREVKKGYTYFERGDVLVAKITPCFENGKAASTETIQNKLGFGSTEFHVLRPSPALDPKYAFYLLWSERFRKIGEKGMTGSAGQKRVPADLLKRLEIPLPPLDEQKRIAAILDKADQLRQKRRQAVALLDSLTQSIFLEMFGDPVSNPKGYPIVEFGSLIKSGPTNGLYKPASSYGEGTRILRINNFYDGAVVGIDKLRRLAISPKEREYYLLSEDDIVINRVNSREYLGKSALVPALDEPTVFESNMMRLSLRGGAIDPKYCIDILQSQSIKQQIARKAKDAVNQSSINQSDVKSFKLMLPPIAKQREYARVALASSTRRGVLARALVEDDQLFSSLQHRAFSGQL